VDLNDRNVIAAATAITIVAGTITIIAELVWKPIRGLLHRHDPHVATTRDTDAIAQQIRELEGKIGRGAEYVDGLPEAVNEKLRAAYQEARLLQLEGYAAQNAHKHKEAIEHFTRALELAENDSQRAALHILRGNSYASISEYGEAEADYQETLKLAERISPAEDAAQARAVALGDLGLVYADRSELEKAEEHYKKALEIDREIGDRLGEAKDLDNLGTVYGQRGGPGDLAKAQEHFKQALETHREISDRRGEAAALGNLGIVYRRRGEREKAEKHLTEALDIQRGIGDRLGEARQLGNLGNVYKDRGGPGDLDKAEKHYKRALEIDREIGNRRGEAADLGNLGLLYTERGDLVKAKEYFQQAQALYLEIGTGGEGPEIVRRALEELERRQQERGK
jgi:tetratricopeptide (TPR) repeat protein